MEEKNGNNTYDISMRPSKGKFGVPNAICCIVFTVYGLSTKFLKCKVGCKYTTGTVEPGRGVGAGRNLKSL